LLQSRSPLEDKTLRPKETTRQSNKS